MDESCEALPKEVEMIKRICYFGAKIILICTQKRNTFRCTVSGAVHTGFFFPDYYSWTQPSKRNCNQNKELLGLMDILGMLISADTTTMLRFRKWLPRWKWWRIFHHIKDPKLSIVTCNPVFYLILPRFLIFQWCSLAPCQLVICKSLPWNNTYDISVLESH